LSACLLPRSLLRGAACCWRRAVAWLLRSLLPLASSTLAGALCLRSRMLLARRLTRCLAFLPAHKTDMVQSLFGHGGHERAGVAGCVLGGTERACCRAALRLVLALLRPICASLLRPILPAAVPLCVCVCLFCHPRFSSCHFTCSGPKARAGPVAVKD